MTTDDSPDGTDYERLYLDLVETVGQFVSCPDQKVTRTRLAAMLSREHGGPYSAWLKQVEKVANGGQR
jgi:hypothetical protein